MSEKRKEVRYIAQKFANAILSDASSYIISPDGLQALNAFLDELLFILIDTAKGLETGRIKSSVYQTFPTALGKNAIVEAELEAKSYIDMGGKDTSNHLHNNGISATTPMFNADSDETRVEEVFEQFRAKCQYYSKLGERLGSPAGNPANSVVIPTLIAIYVTAVLEHVAEYVLQVASQVADRQDHADMVTVREVYVALQEDRQIEGIFEIMILKSQLQKRFRNSLIMPGTGSRPEEQTPATVKRSGSWGKQLRLGNSDKPKLDVQLSTDFEDDIAIDPNRPQFGDWDMPPDEESRLKKKNDFEMLFSSGETMKVSLTPNRLRTIEVHRKAGNMGGAVASRSSSRAASVLGGKEGKGGRRPSQAGQGGAHGPAGARKNSQSAESQGPPPMPTAPTVPSIPPTFGIAQPILKKQQQAMDQPPSQPPLSPLQQQKSWQQKQEYHGLGINDPNARKMPQDMERTSTSTMESQLTLSTAGSSSIQGPASPNSTRHGDGSLKATTQATNDLVNLLGSSASQPQSPDPRNMEPPLTPTSENGSIKKENPIKSFMGRPGRNSMQRTSMDNTPASPTANSHSSGSPTSIRSFTIPGNVVNGVVHGNMSPSMSPQQPYHLERQASNQSILESQPSNRVLHQDSRQNYPNRDLAGFPLPPDHSQSSSNNSNINTNTNINSTNRAGSFNKNMVVPPPLNTNNSNFHPPQSPALHHQQRPMSPDLGGMSIPSRNASLNHELTSPTKTTFSSSYETRTGLEAGLPRPLSPRPNSPRSSSPRPSSPMQNPPHRVYGHSSPSDNATPPLPSSSSPAVNPSSGSVTSSSTTTTTMAPSPLSNSISNGNGSNNSSPSSSSTSLIMYGKVNHIQERLSKTIQPPAHGFKPQEHLQNHPNRISLEGTIRANPFYQQDRSSSVRSSLADASPLNSTQLDEPLAAVVEEKSTKPTSGQVSLRAVTGADNSKTTTTTTTTTTATASKDGMVSPATSPEMGTFKDRLPSATTKTISAAAAAAMAAKQQLATPPTSDSSHFKAGELAGQEQEAQAALPAKKRSSVGSLNGSVNRQFHVYSEQQQQQSAQEAVVEEPVEDEEEEEEEEEDEDEEYVLSPTEHHHHHPSTGSSNRHSIFVDEAAQAMDRLSRARHRQSMRLDQDEDEEGYEGPDGTIAPPEKWHYSDLEDEDEDEDEDSEDDEDDEDDEEDEEGGYMGKKRRNRRKHESFMSAKSVLHPSGSTTSLVDAYANQNDTQDEDEGDHEVLIPIEAVADVEADALAPATQTAAIIQDAQEEKSWRPSDLVAAETSLKEQQQKETDLLVGGEDDQETDQLGEDEDESDDSEDLEDNDDEEGQDRRIYLQALRAQKREARRLERLASGGASEGGVLSKKNGPKARKPVPSLEAAVAAADAAAAAGTTKKRTLRKGTSKESLRSQQQPERPQTPTTPVPTTQVIPLTPTDLVLIRQKLFAAGNFEASMRMLDTIFHAAMAKMVEGRERGIQTEPVEYEVIDQEAASEAKTKKMSATTTATTSTSTTAMSTSTSTSTAPEEPAKQLQWVTVAAQEPAPIEDDDDEDRVVEWLLGGW